MKKSEKYEVLGTKVRFETILDFSDEPELGRVVLDLVPAKAAELELGFISQSISIILYTEEQIFTPTTTPSEALNAFAIAHGGHWVAVRRRKWKSSSSTESWLYGNPK